MTTATLPEEVQTVTTAAECSALLQTYKRAHGQEIKRKAKGGKQPTGTAKAA